MRLWLSCGNRFPPLLQHDGALPCVPDRRPYQWADPHRRHLTSYLSRRHFCSGSEILGVSTERHDANEDVRVDSGWALFVSGVLWLRESILTQVKAADHARNV
jgi:hypothetical protein